MITDITDRSRIGPDLRREKLEPYWSQYFQFVEEATALHQISERELVVQIDAERIKARPYLDSQRTISDGSDPSREYWYISSPIF